MRFATRNISTRRSVHSNSQVLKGSCCAGLIGLKRESSFASAPDGFEVRHLMTLYRVRLPGETKQNLWRITVKRGVASRHIAKDSRYMTKGLVSFSLGGVWLSRGRPLAHWAYPALWALLQVHLSPRPPLAESPRCLSTRYPGRKPGITSRNQGLAAGGIAGSDYPDARAGRFAYCTRQSGRTKLEPDFVLKE